MSTKRARRMTAERTADVAAQIASSLRVLLFVRASIETLLGEFHP